MGPGDEAQAHHRLGGVSLVGERRESGGVRRGIPHMVVGFNPATSVIREWRSERREVRVATSTITRTATHQL